MLEGRRLALALLVVLLVAPHASRAGGQGQGLPDPDFITSFDPDFVFDAMNTSQVGAPAPRSGCDSTRRATTCSDPQLGLPDPFGRLTVVDGIGSTDVCIPDFVSGATLPGKVRVTRKLTEVPVDVDPVGPGDEDVVETEVELTLTLSVVLASGEVQIQSLVVPPSSFTRRPSDNFFLNPPPLVQEVGWFDGEPLCSGTLVLDDSSVQRISVERIAAGSSQTGSFPSIGVNGLNRVALVALGQQELPALLCQPNGGGACTFTPAVAFVEPDGTLSEPTNETVTGDRAECDVTNRFASPAGADPGACEAELGVCQSDLASCLADPPLADADGDGGRTQRTVAPRRRRPPSTMPAARRPSSARSSTRRPRMAARAAAEPTSATTSRRIRSRTETAASQRKPRRSASAASRRPDPIRVRWWRRR
jgi:hypothetical protein